MKKWKKITIECSAVALVMSTLFTASLAWFTSKNNADLGTGQGYTASAYFAGGDGSADNPFIINRPIHLYNLAWLQYLGIFNQTDSSNNIKQKHFVLAADLDMTGWVLPPIGTSDNPFMGSFSGDPGDGTTNYYVVKNLTVDNSLGTGHIEKKPSGVSSVTGVNIVGMFGVVGNYDGMYSSTTNTSGLSVYDSSANYVKDFYLDKATIKTQLKATLMGICAGYVNAPVTGVGVSASKLDVLSGSYKYRSDFTSNISDYTTIGYCTADYKAKRDIASTVVQDGQKGSYYFSSLETGQNVGAGGSIGMDSIFTRLAGYFDDTSSNTVTLNTNNIITSETVDIVNGVESRTTTGTLGERGLFSNYYDSSAPLKGSYSFDYLDASSKYEYSSGDLPGYAFIQVYGQKIWTKQVTTNTITATGNTYSIGYDGNYLIPSGTTGVTNSTSSSLSYPWTFSNISGQGTISTTIGTTKYYLSTTATYSSRQATLTLSTTPFNWTKSGNYISVNIASGTRSRTFYIEYDSDWHVYRRQYETANLTIKRPRTTVTTGPETKESARTNETYFPINTDSSNLPVTTNTGYILGGANYTAGSDNYDRGDIRVSRYLMGDIACSLNGTYSSAGDSTATFSSSSFDVLTQKDTTPGTSSTRTTYCIQDGQNDGGNYEAHSHNSTIDTYYDSRVLYSDSPLNFQKYKNSRAGMAKILKGTGTPAQNDPIYGLHFMNASISMSNLTEVPVAVINRDGVDANTTIADNTYYKYQMPRDSIDFNLQKKGYINFFAGTYFTGNSSFFSLHEIKRTITDVNKVHASSKIDSIQEISKIYGPNSGATGDYIYAYYTNTARTTESTPTIPTNYSLIFDTKWITAPTNLVQGAAYYFEIPVNSGEYALGSVPGSNGAYLMYLDISANAQPVSRTVITEYILFTNKKYEYPLGIAVVNDPATGKETIDALKSVAVSIKSNLFNGTFALSKEGNNVTFTTDNINFSPGYKGDDLILLGQKTDGTSFSPPSVADVTADQTSSYLKRMTYIDRNLVEDITTVTVITYDSTTGAITLNQTITTNGVTAATTSPTQYTNNNGDLTDKSTLTESSIDVSSLPSTASYWYSYFSAQTNVTTTCAFTYALAPGTTDDGQAGQIASITGYTITMTSTGETLTIHVDTLASTYTVTLNGTTVATGPIPTA
jgi:hypothetical protein